MTEQELQEILDLLEAQGLRRDASLWLPRVARLHRERLRGTPLRDVQDIDAIESRITHHIGQPAGLPFSFPETTRHGGYVIRR